METTQPIQQLLERLNSNTPWGVCATELPMTRGERRRRIRAVCGSVVIELVDRDCNDRCLPVHLAIVDETPQAELRISIDKAQLTPETREVARVVWEVALGHKLVQS